MRKPAQDRRGRANRKNAKLRTPHNADQRTPEFKGVVKKIAGRLTSRRDWEDQGQTEMMGDLSGAPGKKKQGKKQPTGLNPDPYRRG